MYYSSGNYEAFARPKKPQGVDQKSAYLVGSGLAALTAACYLARDGQMKGEHMWAASASPAPAASARSATISLKAATPPNGPTAKSTPAMSMPTPARSARKS